jgi:hypothetical protein
MMYIVRTIETHRTISRNRKLERAATRWAAEYWGTDPGTYRQVEVIDSNGDRVTWDKLVTVVNSHGPRSSARQD